MLYFWVRIASRLVTRESIRPFWMSFWAAGLRISQVLPVDLGRVRGRHRVGDVPRRSSRCHSRRRSGRLRRSRPRRTRWRGCARRVRLRGSAVTRAAGRRWRSRPRARRARRSRRRHRRPRTSSIPRGRVPIGPVSLQLLRGHAAAVVGFEPGDRGQHPDAALAESVAGSRVLEAAHVVVRDLEDPGIGGLADVDLEVLLELSTVSWRLP